MSSFDLSEKVGEVLLDINLKTMYSSKPIWKSKTVWVAVAQAAVGILTALTVENPAIASIGWVATGKSLIDFFLRVNTTLQIK